MTHVRKQIRDRIGVVLASMATVASITPSRLHPYFNDGAELPGLAFYTTNEGVLNEEGDDLSRIQTRAIDVEIEGYVAATSSLEDTLDSIAAELETKLFSDRFLNGLSHGIDLVDTDIELSDEAEKPIGVVKMIFRVYYLTAEGAPETAL